MTDQQHDPYAQPASYGQPTPPNQSIYIQQSPAPAGNGLAIASLVVGIIALLMSWILGLNWFTSFPAAIVALILGIVAIRRPTGKGMAIGGIITSALTLLVVIGETVAMAMFIGNAAQYAH